MTSPLNAADLRLRVGRLVQDLLEQEESRLTHIGADLGVLTEALIQFLASGKRLRPAFCYWGWRGAGGDATDPALESGALQVAASLEFLQACALIHDDVMDGSDTRRGQPAMHRRFANLHRGALWLGSSESFGVGAAILLGDLALSWADQLLMTADLPPDALARAKRIYDEMRTEMMAGQYLDMLEQARGGGSIERARTVVRYKSAKYTIERPLHIGAALADADPGIMAAYSDYGLPLGEAFQLRDDVLGVFGDPDETGKPAGDDLREGKRTILVALARDRATPAQSRVLREQLGNPALDQVGVDALRDIINQTGSLQSVEERIASLVDTALAAVAHPGIDPEARRALVDLANVATNRRS